MTVAYPARGSINNHKRRNHAGTGADDRGYDYAECQHCPGTIARSKKVPGANWFHKATGTQQCADSVDGQQDLEEVA